MASASFEEARKSNESFMAGGVALVFPAFDALPEKKLWLGTRRFEGDDGETYLRSLAEMPSLRSQEGIGNDSLDFTINDEAAVWYEQLKAYEDVVVDTEVVAREFLKTKIGIFESEIILNGFLEAMSFSESNLSLQFNAVSDMSRSGFLVGGRILTQRYCAAKFNKNGLKNPLYDACGWTTAQGGNATFCTHKRKGADGCEDHFNDWRLFAVEALTTAAITTTFGENGGWEYGGSGGPCFTPLTEIWMANGETKPIYKIERGDRVMSYTPAGRLCKRKVTQTFTHLVDSYIVFEFGAGREMRVTPEHLICVKPDNFLPAAALDAGDTVRGQFGGDWFDFAIRNNWLKEERTRVHNFSVFGTHVYFVKVGEKFVAVHNSKLPNLEY